MLLHAFVLAASVAAGCARPRGTVSGAGPLDPGTRVEHLRVDGGDRTYALHVPPALPRGARVPLVIILHGYGGSGAHIEQVTGFSAAADSAGFVVAYPDGERSLTTRPHWDVFAAHSVDIDYLRALIDTLERREPIDPARVYVAGFSNGAFMSYRVARELAGRVAAIGVVSGTIGRRQAPPASLLPPRPVPAIIFHGVADDVVPYDDLHGRQGRLRGLVSAPRSAERWAEANGCSAAARVDTVDDGDAIRTTYGACRGGGDVVFYAIPRGGHAWPLPARAGARVPATALIWAFFAAHPLAR